MITADERRIKAVAAVLKQFLTRYCRASTSYEEQAILAEMTRAALLAADAASPASGGECPFYPIGQIENYGQIVAELRIAGQRMQIQAGVMKDWSDRFFAFEAALSASPAPAVTEEEKNLENRDERP